MVKKIGRVGTVYTSLYTIGNLFYTSQREGVAKQKQEQRTMN
jgi:hypothetical protein